MAIKSTGPSTGGTEPTKADYDGDKTGADKTGADKTGVEKTGGETDIKFFEGTVAKVTKDGETVMSDHLMPGEKLRRETDEGKRYEGNTRSRTESDEDKDAKNSK